MWEDKSPEYRKWAKFWSVLLALVVLAYSYFIYMVSQISF